MRRICATLFFLFLLIAANPAVNAQNYVPAPVEISSKIVTVDDKEYYEHLVVEKQTLYSICKAYGADLQEVTYINLDKVEGGLKAGTRLLIPVGGVPAAAPAKTSVQKSGKSESEVADKQEARESEQSGNGEVKYIRHRVKWYDSMLMLSLKYKVSQEEIVALNNLESKTLEVGQYLKIPVNPSAVADADNTMIDVEDENMFDGESDSEGSVTIIPTGSEENIEEEEEHYLVPFSGTAHVALILPLAASTGSPSDNFLDFYSGVLMALNDIKQSGINVNLKVIDMDDFDSFDDMAKSAKLSDFDFIIGHFSIDNVDVAAEYCDRHRIPLFSPMDQKIERATYRHPYLVNVPLSASTQAMRLVESVGFDSYDDNVIVLCENSDNPGQFHNDIISSLDYLQIPYSIARTGIGRTGSANVNGLLSTKKNNHIIITSEKESLAADAVRNTGLLARGDKYMITGYASPKVRRFDSIDQESFQSMNAHFSLGYYVDYKDEGVRNFVRRYRALYNAEPSPYAFQGYDIALYSVNALVKFGSHMISNISTYPYRGLQLNFKFDRRTPGGGMFNEATRNILYEGDAVTLCR